MEGFEKGPLNTKDMTASEYIDMAYHSKGYATIKSSKEKLAEVMRDFAKMHVDRAVKAIVEGSPGQMNPADIPYLQKLYPLEKII